jgi:hypothetical protein
MKKLWINLIVLVALAWGVPTKAVASLFTLTFTDGGANVGSGTIDVTGGVATSGNFIVTAGAATGSWTLVAGSGSDANFNWDSVVNVGSDPFLTGGGLLFSAGANEINIFGNGPVNYSFYGTVGGNYHPQTTGIATLTPVPEPITYALAGFGLIFIGGSVGRFCLRRKSVSPAA